MSSRTAGLPGLHHGGVAAAAASARHHPAEGASLMPGWHDGSATTTTAKGHVPTPERLRELLAEWWRRVRRR